VHIANCCRREKAGSAEIADGTLDVIPGSILSEDRADNDFEAGATGPPVLSAVRREKNVEIILQSLAVQMVKSDGIWRDFRYRQ
jgi:hypothetical protein